MSHRFDWQNPYPTVRIPLFARNVVSTSHPLAAQAGLRMLLAGGSAVDAAIAAAAMLTVVEPVSCGLGSDAFAILWDGKALHGLNASGTAPQAWNLDYFRKKYGEDANGNPKRPTRGWDAVTVPGAISAWPHCTSALASCRCTCHCNSVIIVRMNICMIYLSTTFYCHYIIMNVYFNT